MKNQIIRISVLTVFLLSCSACSIFRSSGEAVESVGDGVGDAVVGTSHAIGSAGAAVGRGAGDIVEGTGSAISRGANRVERKGY